MTQYFTRDLRLKALKFPTDTVDDPNPNTLDDYEEGTWTPIDSSGAGLTFTTPAGNYEKIGRQFRAGCFFVFPATADVTNTLIGNVPFAISNNEYARQGFLTFSSETTATSAIPSGPAVTTFRITAGATVLTNVNMSADSVYATILSSV